jgi:exopolysaccharide production protein ExoQ
MKAPLSILICLPLIIWLWKRDQRVRPSFSPALWIPLSWLLVLGSRPLSFWLGVGGGSTLDGNGFDATLYLIQILASIYIVTNRGMQWSSLAQRNAGLMLFYLFLIATVMWAPYPFVVFKRWFKDFGAIPVILVILTEENPLEAIKTVFARCAYVLFPLSVILLKYFPSIGRTFGHSDVMFTGVTNDKNALGEIIVVFGLVLLAEAIQPNRPRHAAWFKGHRFTLLFTLAVGIYLLVMSDSKTSLICFIIGAMMVTGHKLPLLKGRPGRVLALFLIGVPLFFLADNLFQVSDHLLQLINRNSTLTERTDIWAAVKLNPVNPVTGTGYMMYWDLYTIRRGTVDTVLKTAHNGYLETYLDGGNLGLCFLTIMLLAVGWRAIREFLTGCEYGRLVFAFYAVMLLYNISESAYARRTPLWFAFLLFGLEFRGYLPATVSEEENVAGDSWTDQPETVTTGYA